MDTAVRRLLRLIVPLVLLANYGVYCG